MWRIFEPLFRRNRRSLEIPELRSWLRGFPGGDVILERDNETGIATIRLDHPSKRNAISGYMMTALEDAVANLETWTAGKGVLLYGTGHNFCSGGDLDFAKRIANPTDGHRMATYMHTLLGRFRNLPLLTVAVVEGSGALGGGAEIAMSCDWRLVAHGSKGIGFVHKRMGIAPAWGGATYLVQAVGYRTALELMTSARLVDGEEAVRIGLADHILETTDPLAEATRWLHEKTCGPSEVIRSLKTMCLNARDLNTADALSSEKIVFSPLWGGEENLKAHASKIKHRL